jgi:hypothetical protein
VRKNSKLPEVMVVPKRIGKVTSRQAVNVVVTLTAKDHNQASGAAKVENETRAEWISSLVNTALQP